MATSTVASRLTAALSVICMVASGVMAQAVTPSNSTLPASETGAMNLLTLRGGALLNAKSYSIAPLTDAVGRGGNAATAGVRLVLPHNFRA
jgi:hypothetical protein